MPSASKRRQQAARKAAGNGGGSGAGAAGAAGAADTAGAAGAADMAGAAGVAGVADVAGAVDAASDAGEQNTAGPTSSNVSVGSASPKSNASDSSVDLNPQSGSSVEPATAAERVYPLNLDGPAPLLPGLSEPPKPPSPPRPDPTKIALEIAQTHRHKPVEINRRLILPSAAYALLEEVSIRRSLLAFFACQVLCDGSMLTSSSMRGRPWSCRPA